MKEKFKGLFKDTIIFALGNIGSKIVLFLLVPLYTKYLSTDEYGISDLIFTISQLIVPVASVTIWKGVIRYGLKENIKKADTLLIGYIVSVIGSILILVTTPLYDIYKPIAPWKWYLSVYSIVYIFSQVQMNYLKVKDQNHLYALVSVLQTFTLGISNIILIVYLHYGIRGYILSNIYANIAVIVVVFLVGHLYRDLGEARYNKELLLALVKYSAPLVINEISWWVIHSSDKIMIEAFITASVLGLYTAASKIPSLVNTCVSIFIQAWGISSIKEVEKTNDSLYYTYVYRLYCFFTFGITIVFNSVIYPFMDIYVDKTFAESANMVPLLLVAASFSAISAYFGSLFSALEKNAIIMWTSLAGSIVNLVLNYVFIHVYGIWGVIIGTVVAYILIAVLRIFHIRKHVDLIINYKEFILTSVLSLIQAIVVAIRYHEIIISVICIVMFLIINRSFIQLIKNRVIRRRD